MSPSLSPSSCLSPPSLRTSPFSVLPPELTQLIIEHTVPHPFYSETYKSRQSTLRSLCLVSRTFHHFARPLLLATLWINCSREDKGWKMIHANRDVKIVCREIILGRFLEDSTLGLDLAEYVGLRTLVIEGSIMAVLNLSILGQLPHLSILRLCSIDLSASAEFSLSKLYELSLFQIETFANHAHILNPRTLPSLRLLAYYHADGLLPGVEDGLARLRHQLYAVFIEFGLIKSLTPDLLSKLNPITLFDAVTADLEEEKIQISYVRLEHSFNGSEEYEKLRQRLSQAQVALPLTIFLPLSASPAAADDDDDVNERLRLLEVCAGRKIEVVYEDSPGLWYLNSGFSEHFLEMKRKERRKKQDKV